MANLNNSTPQLPHTLHASGSADSNHDTYDRSLLSDIDPDFNYLHNNRTVNSDYFTEQEFNKTFSNNLNFSLMHLNIRSLPLHFTELLCYLDTLDIEFKIIALSETAINSSHTSYTILSYNCEMNFRSKRKGGGVSLYIHSTLQYKLRNELQLGGEVNSVFIELFKHTTNTKYNVICGCVYRPPSMSLKDFNKLLSDTLDKIQQERKYIYITGDFNVNTMPHLKGGLSIQEFKNIFASNFCFPSINKPTRVTNHSASLIDNIYSNVPIKGSDYHAGVLTVSISDHYGIFCINNSSKIHNKNTQIVKRSYCDRNIANFKQCLLHESWDFVYLSSDLQSAFSRFQGVLDLHLNTNFKKRTFMMNYKNRYPWITEPLRTKLRRKNQLHAIATSSHDDNIMKEYKEAKKVLHSTLRNSVISYFGDQLELNKNDIFKTWKVLKDIIGLDGNTTKQKINFLIDGKLVIDSLDIANGFNNFFVSVGPKLANDLKSDIDPLSYVNNNINSIVVPEIPCIQVREVINSLNNSSPGHDELPPIVAKACMEGFIEPITYLINESLTSGVFPSELKLARVVPIFKSGDPSLLTNYRPISVLSFFSKIFEKIVYNIVSDFLCDNEVLYDYQFGFRSRHSTQQALITLVDRITKSQDMSNIVISLFIDLKKAFDTVHHRILLRKLYAYGIRGILLKWFESYLTDRSQYVIYDGVKSEISLVQCGVPQGSILGPLLFIISMNDICNVSDLMFAIMYADDTCFLINGTDLNKLIKQLNVELESLCTWFKSNKLSLNTQKTFYMVFHRARLKNSDDINMDVIMDNHMLTKVNSIKYLGIIVDHKLNWIDHITYVKAKISKGIGIMYKARRHLNKHSLRNLYYAYIYPYLTYCVEVWGCASKCQLNSLFLVQKKILRIMTFSPYLAHTDPLFKGLKILPVNKLYIDRIGIIMFKATYDLLPKSITQLFSKNKDIHSYNTRSKDLLRVVIGTKNFTYFSPRIWNALVSNININVTLAQFKSRLKMYLLDNTLNFIYPK